MTAAARLLEILEARLLEVEAWETTLNGEKVTKARVPQTVTVSRHQAQELVMLLNELCQMTFKINAQHARLDLMRRIEAARRLG